MGTAALGAGKDLRLQLVAVIVTLNVMIAHIESLLGKGTFTPAEAAFYARIPTQTMVRWLFGNTQGARVVAPEFTSEDGERVVSFLDFVQALAIRAIRVRHKVPLHLIRDACKTAQERYGLDYIFAREHKTFLLGNSRTIVIRHGDDDYQELAGPSKGNRMITQVVEPYLHDLRFEGNLASEYCAWPPRAKEDSTRILMNPKRSFGEPFLADCGVTARTLWDAYKIEGGTEAAAKAYDVNTEDVELACEYYDHLRGTATA